MFSRIEATGKEEFLLPLSGRKNRGVFFLRLADYSETLEAFLWQVHEEARLRGAIVEGQLGNPDDRQLSYYSDMLGTDFRPEPAFISAALKKWMPRMKPRINDEFTQAFCKQFEEMRAAGKNENIQKNVYIKMMCWLYYRFERIMPFLEEDQVPKVLYEGNSMTKHELIFLRMLSSVGTDILLLETKPEDAYLRLDPESKWSQRIKEPGTAPFPADYSLKGLRKKMAQQAAQRPAAAPRPAQAAPRLVQTAPRPVQATPRPVQTAPRPAQTVPRPAVTTPRPQVAPQPIDLDHRFPAPARTACTNAWMKQADLSQITLPPMVRGDDPKQFCNAFIRLTGVKDKLTYVNELFQLYQTLTANQRKVVVIDGEIPKPEPEELQKIRRRNYRSPEELIIDLAGNLPACAQVELQRSIQRAFVQTMKEAAKAETNLNRLTVHAVYLLCWIQRYQAALFAGWKEPDVPCFIKTGACESAAEASYMVLLSRLPVDVLILAPNLNIPCQCSAENLLEITGSESLPLAAFPRQSGVLQMRTVAAHAQEDLSNILYSDTGIYRNRQFARAEVITLQTTYDELFILWDQELKYRPNFSTGDSAANIPVLYAKVSGVEDGKTLPYWQKIKALKEADDTLLVPQLPYLQPGTANPFQALAVKGIKNEKIKKDVITGSRQYPFGLLREEMQEHIFDKLQDMLDQRLIKGTFRNGTEYTVLATVLNMKKDVLRLIQGFDFTKKNPKLVIIHTRDQSPSLEDAIMITFLNRLGFDIALFVPTGYQTIERYLDGNFPVEHQIGEYVYDLNVPDFRSIPSEKGRSWLNNLLRRGN